MKNWSDCPHFAFDNHRLFIDEGELYVESEGEGKVCLGTLNGERAQHLLFSFLNRFGDYMAEFSDDLAKQTC